MPSLLEVTNQIFVGHRELARQVGFDIQILIGRLDRGRHADDIGYGRRRRDCQAVGVAHAELADTGHAMAPNQGRRCVDFDVVSALLEEKLDRILRENSLGPQ
jgi:hypothetical protein